MPTGANTPVSNTELDLHSAAAALAPLFPDTPGQNGKPAQPPVTLVTESDDQAGMNVLGLKTAQAVPSVPEEQPAGDLFRVRGENGEEQLVTLDELRNGYLRQSDYTRKRQAESQRAIEVEAQNRALQAEREYLAQEKVRLAAELRRAGATEPDWENILATYGETGFAARHAAWQVQQSAIRKAEDAAKEAAAKVEQERQREAQARWQTERQRLLEEVPEWQDENVQRADFDEMVRVARSFGASDDQIRAAVGTRAGVHMLRRGMLYERQQAGNTARAQIANAKIERVTVAPPGAAQQPRQAPNAYQAAMAKLTANQKLTDAADVFAAMGFVDKK
jgi:hypothetical protein